MRQTASDRVARYAFAAAAAAPLIGPDDPAGENSTIGFGSLPGDFQNELVEPGEVGQVGTGEGGIRQVEVFRTGGLSGAWLAASRSPITISTAVADRVPCPAATRSRSSRACAR